MTAQLRRLIYIAATVIFAIWSPRTSRAEDLLIWKTKGTIQSIASGSLMLKGFSYTLTSKTVYEKNNHQTNLSAFVVGDYVEVSFLSDHSVLKVEGKSSNQTVPTSTPTPTPSATPDVTKFTARLDALGASTARGESAAGYSATESKFTLHVRIPRKTIPLVTTEVEAKALSVKAIITRGDDVVATCSTAFEKNRAKRFVFEFRTEIERNGTMRSTKARSRKGRCILANGSTGLPTVRAGDLVTVSEAQAGEFLRGDF